MYVRIVSKFMHSTVNVSVHVHAAYTHVHVRRKYLNNVKHFVTHSSLIQPDIT